MLTFLTLAFVMNSARAELFLPAFTRKATEGIPSSQITRFRVLVFPHFGPYAMPQGKETGAESVRITSTGGCNAYEAVLDANQEWQKAGRAKKTQVTGIDLDATVITKLAPNGVFFECSSDFKVNRPLPLKSFTYSGDFVATAGPAGVQIINVVDPETYIRGVVPSEVLASWPMEVLKTQAIAARSYAWWSVVDTRKVISGYDMDDTVFFQAYLGSSGRTSATDSAVQSTSRVVMKYQGEIIKAYFSADSGGYTETANYAFGTVDYPYCIAKPELYDINAKGAPLPWTRSYKLTDVGGFLSDGKLIPAGLSIQNISVAPGDLNTSGRAVWVTVTLANGQEFKIDTAKFRYFVKIRSNLFAATVKDGEVVFNGRGFGHGVGMGQLGALEYVRQLGWGYERILKYYYDGVELALQ